MAFTSSYTDKLIQQSQFFYGTPLVQPDLSGSFSGSFQGDGTNLNLASNTTIPAGATPTLDAVTTAGSTTTNNITAGIISGSVFNLNNKSAVGFTTTNLNIGYHNDWTQINLGKQSTDEIRVNGILNAQQLVQAKQGMEVTGSLIVSGSFIPRGPGVSHISNVSIGEDTGPGLTSGGQYNVMVGSLAGNKLDDEDYNVFIGGQAARRLQYGGNVPNVIIGGLAGANLVGQLGVGSNDIKGNVFLGYGAGQGGITANTMAVQNNVGIGYNALNSVSGGQNNIALGYQAGSSISGGDSNIVIGSGSVGDAAMSNQLRIGNGNSIVTISGSLATGDVIFYNTASAPNFSGSFQGDGTNLNLASNTTIPTSNPFPLTASSAAIISRSIAATDTDSTALRLFGSGSVSESGIFEVEGSAGPLFSVADGLDGILMEVNNISGLPLLQVSSSNEVFVNRGNLTSGVTTATASFAYFTGSFVGDGSGLTGLPSATAGSTSGRVVFTTTSGELTTDSGFDYDSTTNQLTVENLNVTHLTSSFITSSTIETSGSNIFGDDTTDTQTLIGTTKMTGSAEVTGSLSLTGVTNALNFTNTNSTASVSTKLSFRHASGTDYNSLVHFGGNYFRLNNSAYDAAAALYVNGRIQGNNFYAPINSDGFNIASYNSRFTNNYLNLYGSAGVIFGASSAGFATIRDAANGIPSATYDIDALLGIVSAGNSTGYGFKVHNSDSHETFAVQDNKMQLYLDHY